LQAAGAVPAGDYWLSWPDPFRLNPLEVAQTAAQMARSAINVARAVREVPQILTRAEARAIALRHRQFRRHGAAKTSTNPEQNAPPTCQKLANRAGKQGRNTEQSSNFWRGDLGLSP